MSRTNSRTQEGRGTDRRRGSPGIRGGSPADRAPAARRRRPRRARRHVDEPHAGPRQPAQHRGARQDARRLADTGTRGARPGRGRGTRGEGAATRLSRRPADQPRRPALTDRLPSADRAGGGGRRRPSGRRPSRLHACRSWRAAAATTTATIRRSTGAGWSTTPRFHDAVAELAGNPWLRESLVRLRSHLHMYRLYYHARQGAATNVEHEIIADAIASGDPDAAASSDARPSPHGDQANRRRVRVGAGRHGCLTDRDGTAPEPRSTRACEVVIDSHVHVWDPARVDYPWLVEAPALDRRFDLSDVENELDAAGVVAVVLVQAADHIDDTRVDARARRLQRPRRRRGRVGATPRPAAAERCLDRWASRPIVGVRHLVHRDPDPDLLADPRIDDVLAMLAERS